MIRVLLIIKFDEIYFSVQNVWAKYILMNGLFTLVVFEEQKLRLGSLPVQGVWDMERRVGAGWDMGCRVDAGWVLAWVLCGGEEGSVRRRLRGGTGWEVRITTFNSVVWRFCAPIIIYLFFIYFFRFCCFALLQIPVQFRGNLQPSCIFYWVRAQALLTRVIL